MPAHVSPTLSRRSLIRGSAALPLTALAARLSPVFAGQGATPAATLGSDGLAEMLALAPASFPWLDEPENLTISYADIATQLAVTGVTAPDANDDADAPLWIGAIHALALPADPLFYRESWRQDYGFDLFQAEQTLEVRLLPFNLTLYRGRFNHDTIRTILTEGGYTPVEVNGHEILTLREDYHQDLTSPFAYKLAAMNHVALMGDGTIACSSVQAAVVAVLDVAAGQAPSLRDEADVAMLVEHAPAELVSAVIVHGTALIEDIPPSPAYRASVVRAGEMPPVEMALIGATAGGPLFGRDIETPAGVPDARGVALALMQTPEAAEGAVPVVEARLATEAMNFNNIPFSDSFPEWNVRAVPSAPVLVVELTLGPETLPRNLIEMLARRDLGFLTW